MYMLLGGLSFLLGWVIGFCCCWKMQRDYNKNSEWRGFDVSGGGSVI